YDNDGDVDLLISAEADRSYLLRNDGGNKSGHWLLIHLVGALQKDGLGARVAVTAAGKRQVKQRQSGGSYQATNDPRLHFGLGNATAADVEIVWPDGQVQRLEGVEVDQILRVVQEAR
ncbi:MAG: CRTAC1 family protein, partial [Gemmatimonadetes bacterium]|nr:CRTAC1 family protein [Gemmatimonadota bacterium]